MHKTFVIAEAGVNHNGSLDLARRLIDVAAEAGADAVKFQTFRAEEIVSRSTPKAAYQIETTGAEETQLDMLRSLELSLDDHFELVAHSRQRNIEFMSTGFDLASLEFLVREVGIRRVKIPSGEVTNGPLLLAAARTDLPIIISTGMCDLDDIRRALAVTNFGLREPSGSPTYAAIEQWTTLGSDLKSIQDRVTLLHCVTSYPALHRDVNLGAMASMRNTFGLPIGYSDHTMGVSASLAAVALGACVIEKHVTLDRALPGPDHRCSLEPAELRHMIGSIREIEEALGTGEKVPTAIEATNALVVRKSIVASRAISRGEIFSVSNLTAKRPGLGRSPLEYWDLIGTAATRDYSIDEAID